MREEVWISVERSEYRTNLNSTDVHLHVCTSFLNMGSTIACLFSLSFTPLDLGLTGELCAGTRKPEEGKTGLFFFFFTLSKPD